MQPKILNNKIAIEILEKMDIDHYTTETTKTRTVYKIRTTEDRENLLDEIHINIQLYGFPAKRERTTTYSKKGHVSSGDVYFVVKPITGPTENLKIKSTSLAKNGKVEEFDLNGAGKIECYTFTDPESLSYSILTELSENENIHEGIVHTFKKYFKSKDINHFSWDDTVIPSEINELGKYLGELLIGYQALYNRTAKKFIVPNSTRHSGVDCAIISRDNALIPISNKFGVGASASFFPLLDRVVTKKTSIPKGAKTLKRLATIRGMKKTDRDLVFEWGIRTFLGFKKAEVPDAIRVFKDIVSGNISSPTTLVINKLREICDIPKYRDKLTKKENYSSVSSYFCFELANAINKNLVGMEFLKKLLTKNGFWQANLNTSKWKKGEISYITRTAGEMDFKIDGNKSASGDIFSTHGYIQYSLKQHDQ